MSKYKKKSMKRCFLFHQWNDCICKKCGKKRSVIDKRHDRDGCVCKKCGQKNSYAHDWEFVKQEYRTEEYENDVVWRSLCNLDVGNKGNHLPMQALRRNQGRTTSRLKPHRPMKRPIPVSTICHSTLCPKEVALRDDDFRSSTAQVTCNTLSCREKMLRGGGIFFQL
jgi:hypothetical protein